jgi:hypothetical protein
MVGPLLNLGHVQALRDQILMKNDDVVGAEGYMIHTVIRLRIGRGTVTDPLRANHVLLQAARLDRGSGSQPKQPAVQAVHSVGRCGEKRNMVNSKNLGSLHGTAL